MRKNKEERQALSNNEYWLKREEERIKLRQRSDEKVWREMKKNYDLAIKDIERQINDIYAKYASEEGLTWEEAKRQIDRADKEYLESIAGDMVEKVKKSDNKMADAMLRLHTARYRMTRYEAMLMEMELRVIDLVVDNELLLYDTLVRAVKEEMRDIRDTYELKTLGYTAEYARTIVNASFHKATWSDRLWSDQQALSARLNTELRTMLTRGENPRKATKRFRDAFGQSVYATERLLITETARVQSETSLDMYEEMGFTKGVWVTESKPCSVCKSLSGEVKPIKELRALHPRHPFCRCAVAPYEARGK